MSQSQQFPPSLRQTQVGSMSSASASAPRAGAGSGSGPQPQPQHDELHMSGLSQTGAPISMSPQDYENPPQIKFESSPSNLHYRNPSNSSVPNVLQPAGGLSARGAPASPNLPSPMQQSSPTASSVPHQPPTQGQHQQHHHHSQQPLQIPSQHGQPSHDYSNSPSAAAASKPPLSMSHSYSRSSPAAGYDGSSNYHAYTPTTPSGASSSHLMSPIDPARYNAPGSQRTISNTPLGLADIRPRADSSMSDGPGASMGYDANSAQPGTSNYLAPWAIYAFDWCKWPAQGNGAGKLAVGSYLEDGHNFIQILDSHITPTPQDVYTPGSSKYSLEFTKAAEATHSYPVTRLLWEPPSSQKQSTDLLATSGDHLRLWSLPNENPATPSSTIGRRDNPTTKLTPLALLSNSKTPDHTAPLTSLDWNTVSPSLIITSSIDTTCTIWDIPSLTAKTQLIAHDKEVYDVRFCAKSVDVFVSCGQDGSVRMFDLRSLEHSTIIYEPTGKEERGELPVRLSSSYTDFIDPNGGRVSPTLAQQTMANPPPLLRLATSPHDTHLLATFAQDSNAIRILDVRQPGQALLELRGHGGNVNCIEWSPHRRGMLASGGDDCQVLLWDLYNSSQPMNGTPQQENPRSPVASWQCDYEIGNLGWVPQLPNSEYGEWLGVGAGRGIWGTRVA
ncbi:hypothetical protein BFJ70_g10428 [Fusarium oxysporum]|uniref:Uncharacterized protein n=1 Tax=Fusarium oxysporum TaxID=5507 RepID=A0A420SKH9_FUSOX|nr:hypothetical protein BFJ68_g2264 [Fusarium oxysporum]RKL29783.1 hypothetical protein BFJ70_g10428 [Fusarium oxysporum]